MKEYMVRVAGWQNPRMVVESEKTVALEIALSHNHCPTCAQRVRHVQSELARRNIEGHWVYPTGSSSFIEISAPPAGTSAKKHLSAALGLSIN